MHFFFPQFTAILFSFSIIFGLKGSAPPPFLVNLHSSRLCYLVEYPNNSLRSNHCYKIYHYFLLLSSE